MSAAAEIRRHLAHIDIVVGTKADLVLVERLFIDENGTFHSFGNPELIDNAIQIVRIDTVKLHFFLGNHTENTSSIQNPCTAKQRFSENLVLCVGLAVKGYLKARYKSDGLVIVTSLLMVAFFIAQMISQFTGGATLVESVTGLPYWASLLIFASSRSVYNTSLQELASGMM